MGFKSRIRSEYIKYRKNPRAYSARVQKVVRSGVKTGKSIVRDIAGIARAGTEIGGHVAAGIASEGATAPANIAGTAVAGKRGYEHGKSLVNTIRGAQKSYKQLKAKRKANMKSAVKGAASSGGTSGGSGPAASADSLDTLQKLSRG
jgi:hypothetical protein